MRTFYGNLAELLVRIACRAFFSSHYHSQVLRQETPCCIQAHSDLHKAVWYHKRYVKRLKIPLVSLFLSLA